MKYRWILAGALVLASGLELACTATKPTTDDLVDPIVDAALCSFSRLRQAAKMHDDGAGLLEALEDQPLTAALMTVVDLGPLCGDTGDFVTQHGPPTEFEFDIESYSQDFDAIVNCLKGRPSRLGPPGDEDGVPGDLISVVWPDTVNGISDIQLSDDGHTTTGVVEFEAPGCFVGRVPFVAHRDGGQWRVDEFVMPEIGWRVARGTSGLWTTEPSAAPGRRRSASEIWDQAGRTTPLGEDPAVVRILTGGNLAIASGSSEWKPLAGPGLEIGGRQVVVTVGPGATVGDLLEGFEHLRSAKPQPPSFVLVVQRRMKGPTGGQTRTAPLELVTDGEPVRLRYDIAQSPYFCVAPTEFQVSTGKEIPLSLNTDEEAFAFADGVIQRGWGTEFLIDIDPNAPYDRLDVVLDALLRSGFDRAYLATDRHRGIQLVPVPQPEAIDVPPTGT